MARRIVHDDPRIRDTPPTARSSRPWRRESRRRRRFGGLLGRPATSLAHQLTTLTSAGFIDRRHDLLLDRQPVVTIADPMVRFRQLVI